MEKTKEDKNAGLKAHSVASSSNSEQIYRYNQGKTGHGWAAEDGNTLADKFSGKDAKVVGTDNKVNGPDRLVNGKEIQTKYYNSARRSVNAAFKDGSFRYLNKNGKPMYLEVPKDQYKEAVRIFQNQIREGRVVRSDGSIVKDPRQAYRIVKKGTLSYQEAVKIAKGGNVESIWYDIKSGSVNCAFAGGISAAIVFAKAKKNGASTKEAAIEAAKTGGYATLQTAAITAVSGQIERKLTQKATQEVTKAISSTLTRETTKAATHSTAKAILTSTAKTNIITGVVTTAVVTVPDVIKSVKGKQSWKKTGGHALENGANVAGGLAMGAKGAAIGATIGSAVPIVGTAAGAVIGGFVGSISGSLATTGIIHGIKKIFGNKK